MTKLRIDLPVAEIAQRHAEGESLRSLSAAYGPTVHTLSRHLQRSGFTPRSRSEANVLENLNRPTGTGSRGAKLSSGGNYYSGYRTIYDKKKLYVQSYRNTRGCADCGTGHPAVLELHHRDATEKHPYLKTRLVPDGSGRRTYKGWFYMSYADIDAEFEKCIVLCANCHRIRHYNEVLM